jgi:hypothetical protein
MWSGPPGWIPFQTETKKHRKGGVETEINRGSKFPSINRHFGTRHAHSDIPWKVTFHNPLPYQQVVPSSGRKPGAAVFLARKPG